MSVRYSTSQQETLLEIVYIFILPIVLIYLGVISLDLRLLVLLGAALLVMSIIRYQKWTKEQLGLTNPLAPRAVIGWGIFVLIGTVAIIFYAKHFGFSPIVLRDINESWRLLLFFIPISILQEIAYRAFLTERLKAISSNKVYRILLNGLLFTFLHIIYPYAVIVLPVALVGGLLFAVLYEKYPSLILACVVHSILNFTAVLFGLFS